FIRAGISQLLDIDQFERSVQNVKVSFVRKVLRSVLGIHCCNFDPEQTMVKRIACRLIVACSSRVVPTEVEESLDYSSMSNHIERCLDSARHDNGSFFAVEIIRFLTFDNDAIGR